MMIDVRQKIRKIDYEKQPIAYILVFFACLNIFEMGSTLWLLYTAFSIAEFFLIYRGKIKIDSNMVFCLTISAAAMIASVFFYSFSEVVKCSLYALTCFAGFCNFEKANHKTKYVFRICFTMFSAYLAQVVLLYFHNVDIDRGPYRILYSLWGDKLISVTCVAMFCAVIIGFSLYLLFGKIGDAGKPLGVLWAVVGRGFGILGLVSVIFINDLTATRTPFLLLALVVFVLFLYYFVRFDKKHKLWLALVMGGMVVVIALLMAFDAFGIRTAIVNTNLFKRFITEGLGGPRLKINGKHLSLMFVHPFGGRKIFEALQEHAHNYLLNAHDLYGIIAFLGMLGLTVNFACIYWKLFRNKKNQSACLMFFLLYTAWIPQMMTEPVIEGYPLLLWNFIMVHILATCYVRDTFSAQDKEEKTVDIVEINSVLTGSTGKIACSLASLAEKNGYHAMICVPKGRHNRPMKKEFAVHLFGNRFSEDGHLILSRLTGYQGCFSYFATKRLIKKLQTNKPRILHLHNLHNSYIHLPLLFRYIKKEKLSVIWTLHDCWAFTGQCPYFDVVKCEKWKTGCHSCEQYRSYPPSYVDRTKTMWKFKKKWFCGVEHLTLVTPSAWLADLTKQSFLKEYPVKVIHNGIDLSVFKPTESDFRKRYGLEDRKIILGVSFCWGYRKGLDVFIELAKRLDEGYQIVLVGTNENIDKELPNTILSIHRTESQKELAELYSAADVFINPTREDNYPTVNMEALACGTPIVTFRTGGSPEIPDETCGVVVDLDDIDALTHELKRICKEKPYSKEACFMRAREFDAEKRFQEYLHMYEEMS